MTFNLGKSDADNGCAGCGQWDWKCHSLIQRNAIQKVDPEASVTHCHRAINSLLHSKWDLSKYMRVIITCICVCCVHCVLHLQINVGGAQICARGTFL